MLKLSSIKHLVVGALSVSILFANLAEGAHASETSDSSKNWQDAARLQHWDQCGADYTPPSWCESLPKEIKVGDSFSSHRDNIASGKRAEAERMLKAAIILENKIGAAKNIKEGRLYKQDLNSLTKQAESGDKEAMELLAWMYVQGMMPKSTSDLAPNEAAYIWYGRAYLSGATEAKENMDKIWPTLNVTQQRRILKLFK
ncbi:hypothetical protein [Kiloniella antarctica]|uniref:Sel1 repeat family protein n=1 Tax=Kiloniella antarctica TaxID=1550907 RepID=A0ABW5BPF3_9PROT